MLRGDSGCHSRFPALSLGWRTGLDLVGAGPCVDAACTMVVEDEATDVAEGIALSTATEVGVAASDTTGFAAAAPSLIISRLV